MMASEGVRTHHHLWHFVRSSDNWEALSPENRQSLQAQGWMAPRFENEPGSGVDFLGMHREMISMVNAWLVAEHDLHWPSVTGWNPIPWEADNVDWPVPEWQQQRPTWASEELWASFTETALAMRSSARIAQMRRITETVRDPGWLRTQTLDQLGSALEWSIHGWMHIRWSGKPHEDSFSSAVDNDWLFLPWSSHVNRHFWKLHGWIDARIGDWEAANGTTAELGQAWSGPAVETSAHHAHGHGDGHSMHSAEFALLRFLPRIDRVPMPMRIRQDVVESLLDWQPD